MEQDYLPARLKLLEKDRENAKCMDCGMIRSDIH